MYACVWVVYIAIQKVKLPHAIIWEIFKVKKLYAYPSPTEIEHKIFSTVL